MFDLSIIPKDLAWPIAVLLAWLAGEFGYRWVRLPRISTYGIIGFILSSTQVGLLPSATSSDTMLLLANVAFGLILFEFGYRINIRWIFTNPWLGVAGLTEASCTFAAIYGVAYWYGMPVSTSLLLATLAMPTSPAGVLRVINEYRSSGQVTERILHLSALNCVLAVFIFKIILGFLIFKNSGSLWQATYSSLIALLASASLGAAAGTIIPSMTRSLGRTQDSTVIFAITVIFIVALTHTFKLSPILAALTFGLTVRHRRIVFSQTQRNFGHLGDLLSILLFVFITTSLEWKTVTSGIWLATMIIFIRFFVKIFGVAAFSKISGISQRKGILTGLAMMPISVFVILILEQTRYLGVDFIYKLAPLAAVTLILEILGPILTQRALMLAQEIPDSKES